MSLISFLRRLASRRSLVLIFPLPPPPLSASPQIGHVVPEAQVGGPIALVQDGDIITIDAVANTLNVDVSDEEMARRRSEWVAPPLKVTQGALFRYTKTVSDASHGCGESERAIKGEQEGEGMPKRKAQG